VPGAASATDGWSGLPLPGVAGRCRAGVGARGRDGVLSRVGGWFRDGGRIEVSVHREAACRWGRVKRMSVGTGICHESRRFSMPMPVLSSAAATW
jgi:hypothetical protein